MLVPRAKSFSAFALVAMALLLAVTSAVLARSEQTTAPARNERLPTILLVTNALREPLKAILPEVEKFAGRPIEVEYGSSHDLQQKILAGRKFDIVILVPEINQQLLRAGKIRPGVYGIAQVPVAVGLRGDAQIDISTPVSLKRAMLGAASVKYSPTGAAHVTVTNLLAKLNIEKKIRDSSKRAGEIPLRAGEYELCLYPVSEIIPNKTLKNLGPLIAAFQNPVIVQAAVGKDAPDLRTARSLIMFLKGPTIDEALKAYGMEKLPVSSEP